jgi:hypothetical protein
MVGDLEGCLEGGNVSIWSWCQFRDALALQLIFHRRRKPAPFENHKGCATPFRNQLELESAMAAEPMNRAKGFYRRRSLAYLTGTARLEPPKSRRTAKFMPMTFPSRLKSGPPEPPEVVAAS